MALSFWPSVRLSTIACERDILKTACRIDFTFWYGLNTTNTLFTLAPWPSEVLFTLGELYPRQTSQPHEDCLGKDLGEGQV